MVTKIVYVTVDVDPDLLAPLPIPPPPERGASLDAVKRAAAACYAELRAANAARAHLARTLAKPRAPQ